MFRNRALYKWVAISIAVVATGFFLYYFASNLDEIPPIQWNFAAASALSLSVLIAVMGITFGGRIWHLLLLDSGVSVSHLSAQTIFATSQFGKYLPGNVGHHVGRVVLAREAGMPIGIVLNTLIVEAIWGAGIAVGLSILALTFYVDTLALGPLDGLGLGTLGAMFGLLLTAPWIASYILSRLMPGLVSRLFGRGTLHVPRVRTALAASGLYVACFLSAGFILKLHAEWLFNISDTGLLQMTCVFAVAWFAGYIVPGAPGGIGVRESVMVLMLAPLFGSGVAVGLGITLRLTTTLGDATAFLLALLLRRTRASKP